MTLNEAIEKLNELEKASYALGHAQSVLYTDGDTVAPKNSWKGRGKALAYLVNDNAAVNGMHADEHYLFVGNELVAIRVCFDKKMVTFDEAVARVSGMYGDAADVDLAVLANGIYAVDDDGKLEGKAAAVVSGDLMVVIEEDEDEIEVTYVDLTAAYILANA